MLDPATQQKVKQQVEFYFSVSNLPRDRFLLEKVGSDAEGFVDIALLCSFQRMQALLKSNLRDASKVSDQAIAGVADALSTSEALTLSDDKRRVRRREALSKPVEEMSVEVDERSLYASPFPFDIGLDELVDFFSSHAAVNCVRMRRHLVSKDFKGSVFVEFASREEAERVHGEELVFRGATLVLQTKAEYVKAKEAERHARLNSPYNPENAAAAATAAAAAATPSTGAASPPAAGQPVQLGKRSRAEGGAGEAAAGAGDGGQPVPEYGPGCVVHFDFGADAELGETVTFGLVKDSFGGKPAGLRYVDYATGDRQGHARFTTAEAVAAALPAAPPGKMMIAGYEADVRVLEGEEEREYMARVEAMRAEREKREDGGGRGGSRGRDGGGRGRGRGRGRGKRLRADR